MKRIAFILVILNFMLVQAQEGEIIYKTAFTNTSNDNTEIGKKMRKELLLMEFSLRYNAKESYFERLPHIAEDDLSANLAAIVSGVPNNWYQHIEERKSFYNKKVAGKTYLVVFDDKMTGWELSNETKKIEEYTCYKATIRHYNERIEKEYFVEAWYTPEIPISYGPGGYGGLPGLILELRYDQTIFISKKITLNPKRGIKDYPMLSIDNPVNHKEISKLMRKNRKVTPD